MSWRSGDHGPRPRVSSAQRAAGSIAPQNVPKTLSKCSKSARKVGYLITSSARAIKEGGTDEVEFPHSLDDQQKI
jgi:hypothetical protein